MHLYWTFKEIKKKSNYSFEVYYVVKQLIGFPFVAPFMLIVKKNGI